MESESDGSPSVGPGVPETPAVGVKNNIFGTKRRALTEDEAKEIRSKNAVTNPGKPFPVFQHDLDRLVPDTDLDDNVLDAYLTDFISHNNPTNFANVTTQCLQFKRHRKASKEFQSSMFEEYVIVQSFFRHLPDVRHILLPICLHSHFYLVAVDREEFTITVFDSLALDHRRLRIHRHIAIHIAVAVNYRFGKSSWSLISAPNLPLQTNNFDCGFYVMHYAMQLIRGESLYGSTFGALEVDHLRRQVKLKFSLELGIIRATGFVEIRNIPICYPEIGSRNESWKTSEKSEVLDWVFQEELKTNGEVLAAKHGYTLLYLQSISLVGQDSNPEDVSNVEENIHGHYRSPDSDSNEPEHTSDCQDAYNLDEWFFSGQEIDRMKKNKRLNAKRRLERLRRIMIEAIKMNFGPDDFSKMENLKSCYKAYNSEEFSRFLNFLKGMESQELLFAFFIHVRWSANDSMKAIGHLTHFYCIWKHGKDSQVHEPLCLKDGNPNEQQTLWIKLLQTSAATDQKQRKVCNEAEMSSAEEDIRYDPKEFPIGGQNEIPDLLDRNTENWSQQSSPEPTSLNDSSQPPPKLRRNVLPPNKFTPSTYTHQPQITKRYQYCCCKIEQGGRMVKCGNSKCGFGRWFHFDNDPPCVLFNNEDHWYCPNCQLHYGNEPNQTETDNLQIDVESQQPATFSQVESEEFIIKSDNLSPALSPTSTDSNLQGNMFSNNLTSNPITIPTSPKVNNDSKVTLTPLTNLSQSSKNGSSDDKQNDDDCFSQEVIARVRAMDPETLKYQLPKSFEMKIPASDWTKVWNFETSKPKAGYPEVIDKYFEKMDLPCTFKSKSVDPLSNKTKNSLGICKIRGYCNKEGAKSFKNQCRAVFNIIVQDVTYEDGAKLSVTTEGTFVLYQPVDTGRPIKGEKRRNMHKELAHQKPLGYYLSKMQKISNLRFLHGNFPIGNLQVSRKIRSEAIGKPLDKGKTDRDIMNEIVNNFKNQQEFSCIRFPEMNGYVQRELISPHAFVLYSPLQLSYANMCDEIYFDGTGSLIKKTSNLPDVLLHTAVGRISSNPSAGSVPVFEVLSISGKAVDMKYYIAVFLADMKKLHPNWRPRLIVTDFCLSYIHSLVVDFCGVPLDHYLQKKWDGLIEKKQIRHTDTTLFVCSGHMIFAVSRHLRRVTLNTRAVKVALHAFGAVIQMTTEADMEDLLTNIIILFGYKTLEEDEERKIVKLFLDNKCVQSEAEHQDTFKYTSKSDLILAEMFPVEDPKREREKSVFYVHFMKRLEELMTVNPDSGSNKRANQYYDKQIVETFRRWWTYLPLFSKIAFAGTGFLPAETITNGYVEELFKDYKHAIHVRRDYESNFIKNHGEYCLQKVNAALRSGRKRPKPLRQSNKLKQPKLSVFSGIKKRITGKSIGIRNPIPDVSATPQVTKKVKRARRLFKPPTPNTPAVSFANATWRKKTHKTNDGKPRYFKPNLTLPKRPLLTKYFRIPDSKGFGTATDILSLQTDCYVNSVVAYSVGQKIVSQRFPSKTDRMHHFIIDCLVVTERKNKTEYLGNKIFLPSLSDIDIKDCTAYLISFARKHAWLSVLHFGSGVVAFYDSLYDGTCDFENNRKSYYASLFTAIFEKYGIPTTFWKLEKNDCNQQQGVDCVIMAIKNLEMILQGMPVSFVEPRLGNMYRQEFASMLLKTTMTGRELLDKYNNNISNIFDMLSKLEK